MASSSSAQRVGKMVGSGALSHVYIQYPPFRCNIPGSSKMMYDDGNRLLLVPAPNKIFSWPVARHAHSDSPSITAVDTGLVLAARFSLDGKILAIQISDHELSFYNRESGSIFKQICRSRTERILGFFWSDCPTCDVVFVTSGGLELYLLSSRLDSLKLVDFKPSQVSWYLYTHESRLVLLASGVQCKTFLCYQFSAGGIIRLPKFDASLRKGGAGQKVALGPEDVHIATMYGRLYCLQVDRLAMELNIYRFYRDAVVPQGMLPIYSENVAFSVVDGVLLVHQLTSKVVLLYDIFTDMKAPISAPLPLLLRGHSAFAAMGSPGQDDSNKALNNDESNIYGDSWVFANPDIILDQAHGIMWRIHLDLEALAASSSDVPSLLAFLQRRRLDAAMAKQLTLTVLRSIIVEKRPLSLISDALDVINMAYSQAVKTRTTVTKPQSTRPPGTGGKVRGSATGKEDDVPGSSQSRNGNVDTPAEVGDWRLSEASSKDSMEVSDVAQKSDDIVEETESRNVPVSSQSRSVNGNTPAEVGDKRLSEAIFKDSMEVSEAAPETESRNVPVSSQSRSVNGDTPAEVRDKRLSEATSKDSMEVSEAARESDDIVEETESRNAPISSQGRNVNGDTPAEVGDKRLSEASSKDSMEVSEAAQESDDIVEETESRNVPVSSQSRNVNGDTPAEIEDKRLSEASSKDSMEVSEAAQESDDIVEETEKSSVQENAESSLNPGAAAAQTMASAVSAISPEEMHDHVFAVINDDMEVEPSFLGAAIVQYMRSAVMEKLKVPVDLQVLLIQLYARDERYAELMHFACAKILEPSKEIAKQLLQVGKSYPPLCTVGLNMLKQLSAHGDYLSAILQQGRLLEALRYARQNRVEAVAPSTFLELAAESHDMQKLASVMRFCLDFVPSFESTAEYQKYSDVLSHQSLIAA